ncbi:hypothetical protein L9F63_011291, partial [Diploptera punctata]
LLRLDVSELFISEFFSIQFCYNLMINIRNRPIDQRQVNAIIFVDFEWNVMPSDIIAAGKKKSNIFNYKLLYKVISSLKSLYSYNTVTVHTYSVFTNI